MADPILPPWIVKSKKQRDGASNLARVYFYLMKELHLTYEDIGNMPVPAILKMLEQLEEYSREEEKAMKKNKGK